MPNGKKYRTKLMPTVIALALVASGFGIPAAHDAFANDASDVPIREEQLFTEEGVTDSALPSDSTVEAEDVADSVLPNENTAEAERDASEALPSESAADASAGSDGPIPVGEGGSSPDAENSKEADETLLLKVADTASGIVLMALESEPFALADEPVALADGVAAQADYPADIEWEVIKNYDERKAEADGEEVTPSGTCVWGLDGTTVYIRPPDGAATGTLPSLGESKDGKTIPTVPWERVGARKVVILPGVIAGEECQLFHLMYLLEEIEGLENLDISNTLRLDQMFTGCRGLTEIDLPDWNAPKLVSMAAMFDDCEGLTSITLGTMTTPNVTDLSYMFHACMQAETIDLSNMYIPQVNNMHGMFWQDTKLTSIIWPKDFDTSNVTNMRRLFSDCKSLANVDVSGFDTHNVETMEMMFYQSGVANIDISGFRTNSLKNVEEMFYMCTDVVLLDLSEFATENIEETTNMLPNSNRCPKWVKVSDKFTLTEHLNNSKNWYKIDGDPCDGYKISPGATGEYVLIEKIVLEQISPESKPVATQTYLPLGTQPIKIKATVVTALQLNEPVEWGTTSFDSAAIEVDENDPNVCTVTMPNSGTAQVSASLYGVRNYFVLYVVQLSMDKTKYVSVNTSTFDLTATINLTSISDPITWTTADKTIAEAPASTTKPKKKATFKVKKVGTTEITATCNGTKGVGASATCMLTVVGMSLDASTKATYFGEGPFTLTPTIEPAGVPGNVIWSSSDESIATVDENGVVTTHKKGTATITASLDSVENVTASCALSVQNAVVTMAEKEKTVSVSSQPFSLSATVMPASVTQPLTWSSSDESVATVDSDGKVTVLKTGKTTITARCADAEDSCSLTVASLTLSEKARKVGVDASPFKLTATIEPSSSRSVTWKSSDLDVAAVDPDGNVTVKGAGHAIITAELDGATDVKDTFDLTVVSVNLRETSKTVQEDAEPFMMEAVVIPETLADDLSWSSSDPSVATVDSKGQVTVHGAGYTEITAEVGEFKDTCALTVEELPSSTFVSFREATKRVRVDAEPFFLAIDISSNKTVGPVTWSSSDPSVATVEPVIGASVASISRVANSASCKVVVRKPGTVEISAEVDGTKDTCVLTVDDIDLPEDPDDPSNPSDPGGPGESTGSDDGSNTADDPSNAPGNKGDGSGSGGGSSHDLFTTLHALSDTSDGSGMIFFAAASALSSAVILLLTMRSTRKVRRRGSRL